MKEKIKAEINSGVCPVWLSPNSGGTTLTMLQDFLISLERITDFDEQPTRTTGPGDVPCVILRGFSKITSKNDFESAELTYSSDNWNFRWLDDNDFGFFYSDETPFEKSGDKYEFKWRNFYTNVSPSKKEISLSVEAYSIPSCEDGEQSVLSVKLAYPAYITSFQPDEKKSKGIVLNDTAERKCVVSRYGTVELCWNGAADFTDVTVLKKNGISISGSFMINGSYSVKKISENSQYELEVINSYRFSHHLTYDICKTDWQKKTEEKEIFETDIYGDPNFNSQIFSYKGSLYAYLHPSLYKKDENGEWKSLTKNKLYGDSCSCHAAHLYDGTLYAAVSVKDSGRFSMCRYDMEKDKWQTDTGSVRLPYTEKGIPICCGFAVLKHDEYFYCVEKDFVSVYKYNKDFAGWNNGNFYVDAPENTGLIGGGMICRGNRFYIAMLCTENGDAEKKNVYLYDCSEHNEEWLMKSRVSKDTSRIIMLKTINNLWIATDREIINCDKITRDGLFYPVCAENQRAWFGSDEDNVFGIFPDKNLWVYNTFDDSSALSRINENYKPSEKEKSI